MNTDNLSLSRKAQLPTVVEVFGNILRVSNFTDS